MLFAPQPRQGGSHTKCTTQTRAHVPSKRRAHQTQSQKVSGGPTSSASSSVCSAGLGTGSRPAARALHTGAHDVIRLKSRPTSAAREARFWRRAAQLPRGAARHVSRPTHTPPPRACLRATRRTLLTACTTCTCSPGQQSRHGACVCSEWRHAVLLSCTPAPRPLRPAAWTHAWATGLEHPAPRVTATPNTRGWGEQTTNPRASAATRHSLPVRYSRTPPSTTHPHRRRTCSSRPPPASRCSSCWTLTA